MASSFSSQRLALVQMRVEGGRVEDNLLRAVASIRKAGAHGASFVLLPEALDCGWTDPSAPRLAQPIPDGESCRRLREASASHGVFVCAGLTERAADGIYNAAVLIDPSGSILLHHRKINELDIAVDLYKTGDRLRIAETPLGRTGLMICADGFAADYCISRSLGLMGARVILSPCAWAVPAGHDHAKDPYGALWRDSYGPVAAAHKLWIVAASNVGPITGGPWAGRRCIGCSLVVGPEGHPILEGPYGIDAESILYLDLPAPEP